MPKREKSIKANALLNGFRTVLNLIFPLITFPYISRTLSVSGIGKYNFSSSIISYFLLIAALGIDRYAVREGAKYRDDRKKISQFVSQAFTINIVSTIVAYALLVVCLFAIPKLHDYIICILIFSIQILFTTLGTEWMYSIFEEYQYITIRGIVFKVISIILLFAFVRRPSDYLNYAAVTVFATVGSNILNFIHAKKFCDIRLTFKFDRKKALIPILVIFATNIAVQIYVNSDTTMLGFIKDDYTVGIYSVSTKIYSIVKSVLAAVMIVTIPRLAMYLGKHMQEQYDTLLFKVVNVLIAVTLPVMVGLFMLSKDVILIISGQNFLQSTASLRILCIAIIFSIFSMAFNQCVLIPYKREKYSLYSSIISAGLNIGLNFILIPLLAERGAAFTTVLAEFLMMVMNYYSCRDVTKKIFKNRETIHNIITVVIGLVVIAAICIFIQKTVGNMWIHLIFSVVLSAIGYGVILLVLRNPIAKIAIQQLKSKIQR